MSTCLAYESKITTNIYIVSPQTTVPHKNQNSEGNNPSMTGGPVPGASSPPAVPTGTGRGTRGQQAKNLTESGGAATNVVNTGDAVHLGFVGSFLLALAGAGLVVMTLL